MGNDATSGIIGEACKIDAAAGLHGLDAECRGEMTFARSGWAEEVDHLVAVDKVELGEVGISLGLLGDDLRLVGRLCVGTTIDLLPRAAASR